MSTPTQFPRCRACGTSNPFKTINCVKCNTPLFGKCSKCGSALDHVGHCSPCGVRQIEAVAGVVAAPFRFLFNLLSFIGGLLIFLIVANWLFSTFGSVGVSVLVGAAIIAFAIFVSARK